MNISIPHFLHPRHKKIWPTFPLTSFQTSDFIHQTSDFFHLTSYFLLLPSYIIPLPSYFLLLTSSFFHLTLLAYHLNPSRKANNSLNFSTLSGFNFPAFKCFLFAFSQFSISCSSILCFDGFLCSRSMKAFTSL